MADGFARVATFNVQHGRTRRGRVEPARIGPACRALRAEVIALQELDEGSTRAGGADEPAIAAEATGLACAFGPAIRLRDGARYGNALLAPALDDVDVVVLPRLGGEERCAVVARATTSAGDLTVAATHLAFEPGAAEGQLAALVAALLERPGPHVLLGDLNAEPPVVAGVLRGTGLSLADVPPTFPAHRPRARLDHVAAGALIDIQAVEVVPVDVGDHLPLVATLRVRGETLATPEGASEQEDAHPGANLTT